MAAYSGFGGRLRITRNGHTLALPVGRWTVNVNIELVDITNTDSGDIRQYLEGYTVPSTSFDCFWDSNIRPFEVEPSLLPYQINKTEVRLYIDKNNDSLTWRFTNFIMETFEMTDEVRGVARYTVTGKQNANVTDYPFGWPGNIKTVTLAPIGSEGG